MIFVEGLAAPETPRLSPTERAWLCVEMHDPRGGVTRISDDGSTVSLVARTGQPNGLTIDREGVIWIANCLPTAALLRPAPDGQPEHFLDEVDGQALLLPDDDDAGRDRQRHRDS